MHRIKCKNIYSSDPKTDVLIYIADWSFKIMVKNVENNEIII